MFLTIMCGLMASDPPRKEVIGPSIIRQCCMPVLTKEGNVSTKRLSMFYVPCQTGCHFFFFNRSSCFTDKCSELVQVCVIHLPFKIAFLKLPPLGLRGCSLPSPAENHEISPCSLTRGRTSFPLDHTHKNSWKGLNLNS